MESKRNISIDILKVIGILFIILAHANPNSMITQIRSFDVPLLVLISGMLGAMTFKKGTNLINYFKKRFIRLVIPTWIFLTLFFIGAYILFLLGIDIKVLEIKKIRDSFFCIEGIGYVWIIRIYMFCAIALPFLLKAKEKMNKKLLNIIILVIYIGYEILYYFVGHGNFLIYYVLYFFIAYGTVCTYIGISIKDMDNKKILIFSMVCLLIFIGIAIYLGVSQGQFVLTNGYKYPPRLYYLSFAIGVSLLLYYLIAKKNVFNVQRILDNSITAFISSHSMWIYLWHIPFVFFFNNLDADVFWGFKYICILSGGILLTYIQTNMIKKLNIKNKTALSILNG